jgi:hypothetical protein
MPCGSVSLGSGKMGAETCPRDKWRPPSGHGGIVYRENCSARIPHFQKEICKAGGLDDLEKRSQDLVLEK